MKNLEEENILKNEETSQNLGFFSINKSYDFLPRRQYNIISGKDEPPFDNIPSQRGFFSNLAYLNFVIEQDKKNDKTLKMRKNYGLNDGIYDYLKKNKILMIGINMHYIFDQNYF